MLVVTGLGASVLLRPALMRAPLWRATVTPLASIIGSGFLVAGPILAHVAGAWASAAMLGLCAVAYLFGAAVRFNIRVVEPVLGNADQRVLRAMDRCADLALALAYFVSVAYYLNLFASFGLRAFGVVDVAATRIISSAVIGGLGLVGLLRGLAGLERLETLAVGLKLAIIAGLLTALGYTLAADHTAAPAIAYVRETRAHALSVLLGLVILVQGFETSRYLGSHYSRETRVRTMRWAQWGSTAIYAAYMLLATPFLSRELPAEGGETAIIDMLAPVGAAVGPLLILIALSSQFSAGIADLNGAGGLIAEVSRRRLSDRIGYLATACVAIGITWSADIFQIIVYASKAFALYYGVQAAMALRAARVLPGARGYGRQALFAAAGLLALAVLVFGQPV